MKKLNCSFVTVLCKKKQGKHTNKQAWFMIKNKFYLHTDFAFLNLNIKTAMQNAIGCSHI